MVFGEEGGIRPEQQHGVTGGDAQTDVSNVRLNRRRAVTAALLISILKTPHEQILSVWCNK